MRMSPTLRTSDPDESAREVAKEHSELAVARGWYAAVATSQLDNKRALAVTIAGRELVAFRDAAGTAVVTDAHCPHLGAHFVSGGRGRVQARTPDGCLRCPFHGWEFDGSGACTRVPYAKKIPPKARLRVWPTCERNGLVMVHVSGHGRDSAPASEVPALFDGQPERWQLAHTLEHRIAAPAADVLENAVDTAHFMYVHGYQGKPVTELEVAGMTLRARTRGTARLAGLVPTATSLAITFHGPGLVEGVVDAAVAIRFVSSVIPTTPTSCRQIVQFYVRRQFNPFPWLVAKLVVVPTARAELMQDVPIWQRKIHLDSPVLCDGDGPIMKYRKWYAQFF